MRPRRLPWRRSSADTMYAGMPSLICIAAWPSGKWSDVKAASCIVSLNRHGPAAKPGARQVRRARVVLAHGAQHVRVVDAGLVGDREELVRDGELHVAPRVGEQLGELRLLARRAQGLRGEPPEQRLGAVAGRRRVGADDLGQRVELLERVALGDPLGAERDVDAQAPVLEAPPRRTPSCPGRPCCAGRPAHRRGAGARSGRPPARTRASTGRGTRRRASRSRAARRRRGR